MNCAGKRCRDYRTHEWVLEAYAFLLGLQNGISGWSEDFWWFWFWPMPFLKKDFVDVAKSLQTLKMKPFGMELGVLMGAVEARLENEGKFDPHRKKVTKCVK